MTPLRFRPAVSQAHAYIPDWSEVDRSQCIRLDRNEAWQPVPAAVLLALEEHLRTSGVHAYPDSDLLLPSLSAYCNVAPQCVLPTNGSDQAIDLTLRTFLQPGSTMLVARPEFAVFGHVAGIAGASVVGVPYEDDLTFPYERFREEAKRRHPDLLVLINPNNPTGTPIDRAFLEEIVDVHSDTPVIVDEAYFEFTGSTVVDLIPQHRNLIVLRTFSKAFAMAGLRLGYVLSDPMNIAQITKLRNPFDVNSLAIVAAMAQLQDLTSAKAYVHETMNEIKPAVVESLSAMETTFWPGAANFIVVRPQDCARSVEELLRHRILVRPMHSQLLEGTFRVTIGSRSDMERFLEVYRQSLG